MNRRKFLRQSGALTGAVLGLPMFAASSALGRAGTVAPSQRLTIGIVGCGFAWEAWWSRAQCLAVCEVDRRKREAAKQFVDASYGNKDCQTYTDFQELLARPDLDAIYVATPDHWHAAVTIAAARAGKHVYCQKPLTRTLAEGRAVCDAINRYGVVFQHGTQQRSDPKMVFGCELVRNGYIGALKRVKLGSPGFNPVDADPHPVTAVPDGLDWDRWLGPAPWTPFTPDRVRSHNWYWISDYTMGYFAGWGVHHADSAMQGSGLDGNTGPVVVEPAEVLYPKSTLYDTPARWKVRFHFANGVEWDWTDCFWFTPYEVKGWPQNRMGITFEGTEGWVFIWRGEVDAHPKSLLDLTIGPDQRRLYRSTEHFDNFLECIRSGRPTAAPVEVAQRSTGLCGLLEIACQLRRPVRWDPVTQSFPGDAEANRLRSRARREPWHLL